MDPYLGIGQNLSGLYFLIFLIFFPLNGPIERLVYDSYIFISIQNEKLSLFFNDLGVRIKTQRRKNYF
jgi:hypothetical protein